MRRGKCGNCERLSARVAELEKQLAAALARIAELERQLAAAGKDSSTSSKPASSDIVERHRQAAAATSPRIGGDEAASGGQPGHARHEPAPFGPEEVDAAWTYEWPAGSFGPDWKPPRQFDTLQQVDLVLKLFQVTEHRARKYLHRPTGRVVAAALVRRGRAWRAGRSAAVGAGGLSKRGPAT